MATQRDLYARLRERQVSLGESDATFAARIGISRAMWYYLRTGTREAGPDTLARITTAFPDLYHLVIALFLPGNATNVTTVATNETSDVA